MGSTKWGRGSTLRLKDKAAGFDQGTKVRGCPVRWKTTVLAIDRLTIVNFGTDRDT